MAAGSGAGVREPPLPLREVAAPGWRRWASQAAIAWALGYGSLRIYWALGAAPSPPPTGSDLVAFTGWWSVALCGAAAVVVLGLRRARWLAPLAVAAWGVTAALAAAGVLLLLDVIGIILPGVGLAVRPAAVLSRSACLAGGVLVGATALCYQRHWRGACLACGRTGEASRSARPPRWAWLAAWAAVAGCLVRLLAQVAVGFGSGLLRAGGSVLLFEAGFLLAGTVLPLALVYRWGRVFPRWVPLLAGRGVPRWLVLGPALGLGVTMTAYFGVSMVWLAVEAVSGTWKRDFGSEPLWFFWLAVPGYLAWGVSEPVGSAAVPVVDARGGAPGTRIDVDDACRWFQVGGTVVKAVDEVNLHVDGTAFVVVLGASGSGKTTLLRLIGALDAPTAGTIRLAGRDVTTAPRAERTRIRRKTVSFIFQGFNLFPGADRAGERPSR